MKVNCIFVYIGNLGNRAVSIVLSILIVLHSGLIEIGKLRLVGIFPVHWFLLSVIDGTPHLVQKSS